MRIYLRFWVVPSLFMVPCLAANQSVFEKTSAREVFFSFGREALAARALPFGSRAPRIEASEMDRELASDDKKASLQVLRFGSKTLWEIVQTLRAPSIQKIGRDWIPADIPGLNGLRYANALMSELEANAGKRDLFFRASVERFRSPAGAAGDLLRYTIEQSHLSDGDWAALKANQRGYDQYGIGYFDPENREQRKGDRALHNQGGGFEALFHLSQETEVLLLFEHVPEKPFALKTQLYIRLPSPNKEGAHPNAPAALGSAS